MDKGWAWVVLVGCCMNRMLNDGILSSLGVFIVAWRQQFPASVTQINWILSLIIGITHMSGPLGSALCSIFTIRQVVICGTILASISFIIASLATQLWQLYVAFAMAGIGFGLSFLTSTVILTYYFDKRLARANGISSAGAAIAIFALPPLFQLSIDYYGWQGTLLILAGLLGNIGACGAVYRPTSFECRGKLRNPHAQQTISLSAELNDALELIESEMKDSLQRMESTIGENNPSQQIDSSKNDHHASGRSESFIEEKHENDISISHETRVKKKRTGACVAFMRTFLGAFDLSLFRLFFFDLLMISYFVQGLGYHIALHYISPRAVQAGISELNAAYLISAIGISSLFSRITHGYLIDYGILSPSVLTALSCLVCAIACAFNPLTDNYGVLVMLSVLVGLSSGVFNSTNPLLAKEYVGMQRISHGVGLILCMIGTGIMCGAYLTGILVDGTGSYDVPFYLAGACFMINAVLIITFPIIKYQRSRRHRQNGLYMTVNGKQPVMLL